MGSIIYLVRANRSSGMNGTLIFMCYCERVKGFGKPYGKKMWCHSSLLIRATINFNINSIAACACNMHKLHGYM